jgi:cytochrome c2
VIKKANKKFGVKNQRNEGKCQACHGIQIGGPERIGQQIRS